MKGLAEPDALQKLCLVAERKRWRVRLTIHTRQKNGISILEDLIVEERASKRIIAAEPLFDRDVIAAAKEILRMLKIAA